MYVEEVDLQDFRAIRSCSVSFLHPALEDSERHEFPNINVVLGTNGGGKSTLLMGIAAAAMAGTAGAVAPSDLPDVTSGRAQSWPRLGGTEDCVARVRVLGSGDRARWPETAALTIDRTTGEASSDGSSPLPDKVALFGYGSTRSTSDNGVSDSQEDGWRWGQVASLFGQDGILTPPEPWLQMALRDERTPGLGEALQLLMPPETSTDGRVEDGLLVVRSRGLEVPRTFLSDGARSYLGWVFDLLYRLDRLTAPGQDLRHVAATVLVDEVDQRLHPAWQQSLLSQLSGALPRVQFICAAHSPLVVAGLRAENLTLVEPDPDTMDAGAMRGVRLHEDLFGQSADGVLMSSYFGVVLPRSDRLHQRLRDLAQAAEKSDEAALEFMRTLTAADVGKVPPVRTATRNRPKHLRNRRP